MARRALSASRSADLLNFLAAHPDETFGYTQLSQRLGINLASMHSLLTALTECGYLARSTDDRRYALGPALVALGDASLRANPLVDAARRSMRRLGRAVGIECVAFVRAGHDALCIARAGPASAEGRVVQVGQRIPLMAPLASVYVAWAGPEEVEQWLLRGETPQRARTAQLGMLERVRARGYSVGLEVEGRRQLGALLAELSEDPHSSALRREMRAVIRELGVGGFQLDRPGTPTDRISTITAPVFDAGGTVRLSISLQVFRRDPDGQLVARLGKRLLGATRALTRGHGGVEPTA